MHKKLFFAILFSAAIIAISFQTALAIQGTLQQTESFEGTWTPTNWTESGQPYQSTTQFFDGANSIIVEATSTTTPNGQCNLGVSDTEYIQFTYTFQGAGSITFYNKKITAGNSGATQYYFYIDGVLQYAGDGNMSTSWTLRSFDVSAGSHTFKWHTKAFAEGTNDETCGQWYLGETVSQAIDYVQIYDTTSTAPSVPLNLSATTISHNRIDLDWDTPSSDGGSAIIGYKIERAIGAGAFSTLINNTGTTTTSYSNTGLTPNTLYKYKVYAWNSVGSSNSSNTAQAITNQTQPNQPLNLIASAINYHSINLDWDEPYENGGSPVTNYRIDRAIGSGAFSTLITIGNITNYLNEGLNENTLYKYKVFSINGIGTGNASNTAQTTTPTYNGTSFDCYFTRFNNFTQITILGQSTTQPFNATFRILDQFQNQSILNFTNVSIVNQTYSVNANSTLYFYGYHNPTNLLQHDCYGVSYRNPETLTSLAVFGEYVIFGLPAISLFPVYVAGVISPKKAGAGLIVIGAVMGIMGAMGFIIIPPLAWGLIVLQIALGVFIGRRSD